MKRLILVCLCAASLASATGKAFGWGAVGGRRRLSWSNGWRGCTRSRWRRRGARSRRWDCLSSGRGLLWRWLPTLLSGCRGRGGSGRGRRRRRGYGRGRRDEVSALLLPAAGGRPARVRILSLPALSIVACDREGRRSLMHTLAEGGTHFGVPEEGPGLPPV